MESTVVLLSDKQRQIAFDSEREQSFLYSGVLAR